MYTLPGVNRRVRRGPVGLEKSGMRKLESRGQA